MSKIEGIDEILGKLRDWLQGTEELRHLIDEYLSKKVETSEQAEKHAWDTTKLKWTERQGKKGPYLLTEKSELPDYKALLQDLENHNGKMTVKNEFFWIFPDGQAIGRKPSKK